MDEDDQGAAEAHQMELEQRQQEEEAVRRGRALLASNRRTTKEFEADMTELNERIETNWRNFHGDHGI